MATIDTVFGINNPSGKLPVNVPKVVEQPDGTQRFSDENLYDRGFGLTYDDSKDYVAIHRLYNPYSGEHFFTGYAREKDELVGVGWNYEGISWYAPQSSGVPVYRLYNQYTGDHHYTADNDERDYLIEVGWNDEGIGWYSSELLSTPLFRLYNPNALMAGAHHFTADEAEKDYLAGLGWKPEGIGWYGM